MKAKLLRNEAVSPGVNDDRIQMIYLEGKLQRCWPARTIIDNPNAWRLVVAGVAVAEDDECRSMLASVGVTAIDIVATQDAQERFRTELTDAIDTNRSDQDEQ